MEKSLFTLGVVTGVHGVKGLVRVRSFAESFDTFEAGLEMVVQKAGNKGERHTILKASPHKKGLLIQFAGVDRNIAETLVGAEILVERDRLPEPEADSYFWEDLIGLRVTDKTLGALGTIDSIMETGSNDVFVVKNKTVDSDQEFLVPALASVVIEIDLDRGEMVVDLPEGL
ncbi:MAG: ribosome maturation factor RimM [Desulfobacterium sp.]|jgi:16S rRNA processing protein RimM|nr:ribosome maturation factor RimM [Desulfobacterium sp.]